LALEFIDMLGAVIRNIDPDLFHNLNRCGVYLGRICPGAKNLKLVFPVMPEHSFRHLRTTGITSAQNQNPSFHGASFSLSPEEFVSISKCLLSESSAII
jgi:hypothetical protein